MLVKAGYGDFSSSDVVEIRSGREGASLASDKDNADCGILSNFGSGSKHIGRVVTP